MPTLERYIQSREALLILEETDPVMKAVDKMISEEAGVVLIAENGGHLTGIMTERDVMTRITAPGLDPYMTPIGDVMTREVITLDKSAILDDAVAIMRDQWIRYLPIVAPQKEIVGMLSLRYFLHDTLLTLVEELRSLEGYLNDAPGG